MCIIVAKPAGKKLPSKQTLMNCYANNPDGAGFMYADGKTVHIDKGYFDFTDFYDALLSIKDITNTSIVMHFRISTAGSINESCCHPFPVSSSLADLSATEIDNRVCVAHNGIIKNVTTDKTKSDTMVYIMDVIAPLRRMHEDFMHNENALDVLRATCQSKLCFMDNSGDIVTIGEFQDVDGVLFSNSSFTAKRWDYSTHSTFWDSLDYDEFGYARSYGTKNTSQIALYEDVPYVDMSDEDYYALLPYSWCEDCVCLSDCINEIPYCSSEVEAEHSHVTEEEVEEYERVTLNG